MSRQNLGDMLLAANLIDEVQMQVALAEQNQSGRRFGSTLVDLKFIDENVLAAFLSRQMDVPCISLLHVDIPKKVLRKIPRDLARECKAIPVRLDGNRLEVAMVDPSDDDAVLKLRTATLLEIVPLIAPESSIESMIERFYPEPRLDGDDTMAFAAPRLRNAPSDPVFWDVIADLDSGDLDERLTRIEQNLDRVWILLEKVLRVLEARDVARPDR